MNAIELKTGSRYWRNMGLLWGLFVLMGLPMVLFARQPIIGVVGVVMLLVPVYMLLSRRMRWAARMDSDGVTLMSGKFFRWDDLEKVIDVTAERAGARWHNHYELVFNNGRARVFDLMLKNRDEAVAVLESLAHGENPFYASALGRATAAQRHSHPAAPGAAASSAFTVWLTYCGENKISVIKEVRDAHPSLGLKEAKDLVESAPQIVRQNLSRQEAEAIRRRLEAVGARAQVR